MKFKETADKANCTISVGKGNEREWRVTATCEFAGVSVSETVFCAPDGVEACAVAAESMARQALVVRLGVTYRQLKSALREEHKIKRLDGGS